MQITVTFVSDKKIDLPVAYRYAQQSLIYNVLRSCPEYSQKLHNYGASQHTTGFKLFTFSPFKGNYIKVGKRLIFDGRISFEIRCYDAFMAQLLLAGLNYGEHVTFLCNELIVESCVMADRKILCGNTVITTVSPIAVLSNAAGGKTVYHSPEDDSFYERIIANSKRKWCTIGDEEAFALNIYPADTSFRKLVTLFKKTYVNAWYGSFVLEGNPAVVDFLYNVGLGNKSSQGFGMFEIIED